MVELKYKIGDKVRIKSIDWYYENRDRIDEVICGNTNFIPDMVKYCGEIVTISSVLPILEVYHIKEDGGMFNWTDEMIEELVEEEIIDIDDFQDDNEIIDVIDEYVHRLKNNECQINLPEGYQFTDENGNVINAQKIVLERKKKEYPKTYEECRDYIESCYDEPIDENTMVVTSECKYRGTTDKSLFKIEYKSLHGGGGWDIYIVSDKDAFEVGDRVKLVKVEN